MWAGRIPQGQKGLLPRSNCSEVRPSFPILLHGELLVPGFAFSDGPLRIPIHSPADSSMVPFQGLDPHHSGDSGPIVFLSDDTDLPPRERTKVSHEGLPIALRRLESLSLSPVLLVAEVSSVDVMSSLDDDIPGMGARSVMIDAVDAVQISQAILSVQRSYRGVLGCGRAPYRDPVARRNGPGGRVAPWLAVTIGVNSFAASWRCNG